MPKKIKFYERSWDIDNPKAVVMLIHGVAEHSERYNALGNFLNTSGYAMMAIDLPGHGRSPGIPGHINQFTDYTQAALKLHKSIKKKHPKLSVFLIGHSMGGLISTQLLIGHQKLFKGALLSGAAIETEQTPPQWQVRVIKLISLMCPKLGVLKIDSSFISRDPAVIKKYTADPLVNTGKLSARLLVELSNAMAYCKARAAKIKLPILIMHGGSDVVTAPSGSHFLYENISSSDKTIKIYDDLFHEIFNEPEAKSVYSDMLTWLDSRN